MSYERDEIKNILLDRLYRAGYQVRLNYFVRGQDRDTIIPICLMADDDTPCLAIRIRIRKKDSRKYSKKPSQRLHKWEEITGSPTITVWCRSDAENIVRKINSLFFA